MKFPTATLNAIADACNVSYAYACSVRGKMRKENWKPLTTVSSNTSVDTVTGITQEKLEELILKAGQGRDRKSSNPLDVQVAGEHYKNMKIQPVEFITANGLGFLEGCIIKRICRWESKDGIQDLEKIKHEVDLLIALKAKETA